MGVHRYTPPHAEEALKATSALADFILVPTRPAILDLRAIADTVGLVRGKPAAIVLNSCAAGKGVAEAGIVAEAPEGASSLWRPDLPGRHHPARRLFPCAHRRASRDRVRARGEGRYRDPSAVGLAMPKREPLNVDDYASRVEAPEPPDTPAPVQAPTAAAPTVNAPDDAQPMATLYCRCPLPIADRLKRMALERTIGKRKRTTQNDLILEAVQRFLDAEGF